jgi:hypothetical protein
MVIKNKDNMKKIVMMTLDRVFPAKHKRAGAPTMFASLLYANRKIHSVRVDASGLWAKRCEDVNSGKRILSVREWTGRPYFSEQREIKRFAKVGMQHITMAYSSGDALPQCWIDDKRVPVEDVASNDGLSVEDFVDYIFGKCGCKENVFEGVVIHLTDYRY